MKLSRYELRQENNRRTIFENRRKTNLYFVGRLKQIAADASTTITDAVANVEKQGKFNAVLNLCFLDFIVINKNALAATHFGMKYIACDKATC